MILLTIKFKVLIIINLFIFDCLKNIIWQLPLLLLWVQASSNLFHVFFLIFRFCSSFLFLLARGLWYIFKVLQIRNYIPLMMYELNSIELELKCTQRPLAVTVCIIIKNINLSQFPEAIRFISTKNTNRYQKFTSYYTKRKNQTKNSNIRLSVLKSAMVFRLLKIYAYDTKQMQMMFVIVILSHVSNCTEVLLQTD